mmetsp:Transcript_2724/g.7467  ORF Transcript_2724/g.7467 Transcript_2724/m.7467 type:complete len:468 (+) Transcript_2724:413-1816(+)
MGRRGQRGGKVGRVAPRRRTGLLRVGLVVVAAAVGSLLLRHPRREVRPSALARIRRRRRRRRSGRWRKTTGGWRHREGRHGRRRCPQPLLLLVLHLLLLLFGVHLGPDPRPELPELLRDQLHPLRFLRPVRLVELAPEFLDGLQDLRSVERVFVGVVGSHPTGGGRRLIGVQELGLVIVVVAVGAGVVVSGGSLGVAAGGGVPLARRRRCRRRRGSSRLPLGAAGVLFGVHGFQAHEVVPQLVAKDLFGGVVDQRGRQRDVGRGGYHVAPDVLEALVQLAREGLERRDDLQRLIGIEHVDQNGLLLLVAAAGRFGGGPDDDDVLRIAAAALARRRRRHHHLDVPPGCAVVVVVVAVVAAVAVGCCAENRCCLHCDESAGSCSVAVNCSNYLCCCSCCCPCCCCSCCCSCCCLCCCCSCCCCSCYSCYCSCCCCSCYCCSCYCSCYYSCSSCCCSCYYSYSIQADCFD